MRGVRAGALAYRWECVPHAAAESEAKGNMQNTETKEERKERESTGTFCILELVLKANTGR